MANKTPKPITIRPASVNQIKANEVASDFTTWCNNKSDCLYKDKKRTFHGWINLKKLSVKNGQAQCGWDNGDCNHSTAYGIGGYHNICPIGGFNGDKPWPAKLKLSNFNLKQNGITSSAKIHYITVSFEHRMVGCDTGSGSLADNWGPTFHASSNSWSCKLYFTKGNDTKVSSTFNVTENPRLSKSNYNTIQHTFTDISISELMEKTFALNIEYNHNYNTNPGILYIKNVQVDISFTNAEKYIEGKNSANSLYTSKDTGCNTTITQTIEAGYKNSGGKIPVSQAPAKLGSKIQVISSSIPTGVTVTQQTSNDNEKTFLITDKSEIAGNKTIKYKLSDDNKKTVSLTYKAVKRNKPTYSIVRTYKEKEDYDSTKSYIIFKNGCASSIKIYIDSINATPLTLNVANQNSSTNLLNATEIKKFHDHIKTLSCGNHTLYIQRGSETKNDAKNNKVTIQIQPMEFKFEIYSTTNSNLIYNQTKLTANRYETISIKRVDNEPMATIPSVTIADETNLTSTPTTLTNVTKNSIRTYNKVDKYYAGEFFIKVQYLDTTCPVKDMGKAKITVNSTHKQNYDYLFTKVEDGTSIDCKYLVAWEGDLVKTPVGIKELELINSEDTLRFCSNDAQAGLSQIGIVNLYLRNTSNRILENIGIELNTLILNDNDELEVTTTEWTSPDGIFNQFYDLFYDYNEAYKDNLSIRNLTPDNDLVDEENVYLFIKRIEASNTIQIQIPFRSIIEKDVYLQYLLFEEPQKIYNIGDCTNTIADSRNQIQISVVDSMLTQLEITGQTDLLNLDKSFTCPTECYTTKTTNDNQSGGLTYKITNIDTNDFEDTFVSTEILNSNEMQPYGYWIGDHYYALIDNNGNKINVQEQIPMLDSEGNTMYQSDGVTPMYYPNKLTWSQEEKTYNKEMNGHLIYCYVNFPSLDEQRIIERTDKNGLTNFFVQIPPSIGRSYTIDELLDILYFEFKEIDDYNGTIYANDTNTYVPVIKSELYKNETILSVVNNYRRYKPGEYAHIPVYLSTNIKTIKNILKFNAQLHNMGDSDEVTILYRICNISNNEGIFKTTFKTNDKLLIPNEVSKNIYCGLTTDIHVDKKLEKQVLESETINVIYLNVTNQIKENQDVSIEINLGKHPNTFMGNYSFLDINIESGDYSIDTINGNVIVTWLIGQMDSYELQKGIIKIKAQDVGLSDIQIATYDYIHQKNKNPITVKNNECNKCTDQNDWKLKDSPWKKFNGIWYKKINNQYMRKVGNNWVVKND